jgi:hypothetical protein
MQLLEPPKPNEFDIVIAHALPPRRLDDEIEIAIRIAVAQIRVHRHFAAIDRERAHDTFDRAGRGDQMPHRALGRARRRRARVAAEHRMDRRALAAIVHRRRRAVRIDVVDVAGRRARVGQACRIAWIGPSPSGGESVIR